ncbi:uncharacterized protein A4U43_C04F27660 [Asparagus officinalis]|uniref:Uncharacterized protein n=1 Tax=Asparagus officinalis TaxID=4686 RepID=A0A5P1F9D2_ASPOF|nr:uncharacterized protein A4U43_C04F27660 [Asparagus officinalis]
MRGGGRGVVEFWGGRRPASGGAAAGVGFVIIMSHIPRGQSPTASADGVLPSYAVGYPSGVFSSHAVYGRHDEYYSTSDDFLPIPLTPRFTSGTSTEVAQVVKEGGHRVLRQLITDAPFVKDTSSVQPLRKTNFLFGDSVRDPDAVFIDAEQWLHKDDGGFLYFPKIPQHRSLTELRRQAVTLEMSWRLTEEHESVHCGYITHHAAPANKTVPVKPIAELVAEEASQADSRVIWENARLQRTRSKTRRIDEEGKKIFNSADEASGGDLEDYEDCSERGTAANKDEEFRPLAQARPSIVVPAARRKRLAHKPRAEP